MSTIARDYVTRVCQPTQPTSCAYLLIGPDGWECAKDYAGMARMIADRLAAGTMCATGDHCPGWAVQEGTP